MARRKKTEHPRDGSEEWSEPRVREACQELETMWSSRKTDDKNRDSWFKALEVVEAKAQDENLVVEPKIVRWGRYAEHIDLFTGLLSIKPKRSIAAYGVGKGPQEKAEKAGKFLNTAPDVMEYQLGEDTNYSVTQEALIYGLSGLKTLPLPQARHDYPTRTESESDNEYTARVDGYMKDSQDRFPIGQWHVPTLEWFPLLHGRKVLYSVEKKEVYVSWVKSRYPDIAKKWPAAKKTDKVWLYEVIDPEWVGYYCSSSEGAGFDELRFWRHHMDLEDDAVPVALYEGMKTSQRDFKYRWRGVLDNLMSAYELEDFLLTRQSTVIRTHWSETVILELTQNYSASALALAQEKRKFKINETNVVFRGPDGKEGERYIRWDPPQNLPDAERLYDAVRDRYEGYVPPVLEGQSNAGDSGYKDNLATERSQRKLEPIADNLARGDVDSSRHLLHAVRAYGYACGATDPDKEMVYVRAEHEKGSEPIGVNWEMVKTYAPLIRAARKLKMPLDRLAQADAAIKFLSDPIKAPRKFVLQEILDIENPAEFDTERWAEDIQNSEAIRKKDEEKILERLGIRTDEEEGMTPEELQSRVQGGESIPPNLAAILAEQGLVPGASEATSIGAVPPDMGNAAGTPVATAPVQGGRAGQATAPVVRPGPPGVNGGAR